MKNRITSHLLTKDRDSLILGRGNDVGQYINKNAINRLQSIPWELNEDILHLLEDTLKPSEEPLGALEESNRVKSYHLRNKETNDVIDYLLENDNKFYFGWKYDKRGRMYSQGYHVNPMGNEYRKAMLRFSDKQQLDATGIRYLKYDIANCMGYDKETWYKRTVEANKIVNTIFVDNIFNEDLMLTYSREADTPLLFIKAINAYYNGVILNKPISEEVYLDASSSGIQIMSTMAGCVVGAKHSNVHASTTREYTEEAQEALELLELELANL